MSIPRHSFFSRRRQRRGVALLVTIILLVFLVLIVVALSSLVRVETQIAVNTDAVAQARQNALVGVNMALGRLQETAGPDRRVTARADILGTSPDNSYLTGVWDSSGNLITWLVNGNENHNPGNPVVEPASPNSKSNANSRILNPANDTAEQNPINSPLVDDVDPPANIPATPSTAIGQPVFSAGHVYLVSGRVDTSKTPDENLGSVDVRGNSDAGSQAGYKDAIAERIILRKSPILVDGASVPGKAAGTNVQIGNYAFWVADDGIRASVGSSNRAGIGLDDFSNTIPAPDLLHYDDAGATPSGMDYNQKDPVGITAGTAATNGAYLARKFLNGIQLQSTRADLVLRDTSANDIFRSANRIGFYPVLSHPANADFFAGLFASEQMLQAPLLRDYFPSAIKPDIGGLPATFADFQADIHDRLRQRFHDITPKSRAVLTDMITGGLKKDLSFEVANSFPNTPTTLQPGVQSFMNVWRQVQPVNSGTAAGQLGLEVGIVPPAEAAFASSLPADTAYYSVAPIISAFELRMECSVDVSGNLQVGFTGLVELWNPHNVELQLPASQNLYVTIPMSDSSLTARLSNFTVTDSASAPFIVNLEQTLFDGNQAPATPRAIYRISPVSGTSNWKPGEIKRWRLDGLSTKTARDPGGVAITGVASGVTQVRQSSVTNLTVTLHIGDASDLNNATEFDNDTSPLYEVRDVVYVAPPAGAGAYPNGLSYFFRPKDQMAYDAAGSTDVWLEKINPQGPVLLFDAGSFTTELSSNFQSAGVLLGGGDKILVSSESGSATFVTLFDVPRQEPTHVGAFQHLAFTPPGGATRVRAYRIGSPNSGGVNNIYDTHFISTVPRGSTATTGWSPRNGDLLANTALRVFDPAPAQDTNDGDLLSKAGPTGLQTAKAAEYLLIDDAFNINSTSVPAWMGVLGGSLPALADPSLAGTDRDDYVTVASSEIRANWRYLNATGDVVTQPLANVFFRLPQTAHNVGGDYVVRRDDLDDSDDDTRAQASFRLGLREFTAGQIERLATAVVTRLKAKRSPFLTLSSFVDSGLLDQAIADANLNVIGGQAIPKLSTAYLTQGDILQLIAPRLTARSDTFTVRSYGDVVDPLSGEVRARAWVEATIQRTPIKHRTANQPADNTTNTGDSAGNFGRLFKIVNLRWLSPDEI